MRATCAALLSRSATLVSVLCLVAVLVPSATSVSARSPLCSKKGGKTLRASKEARVFKKRRQTYACLRRARRAFRLGGYELPRGDDDVRNFRLRGRFVAYSLLRSGLTVRVMELRRGRIIHNARAARGFLPFGFLTDIRLARSGAVAWIVRAEPIDVLLNPYAMPTDFLPSYEVAKSDRRGYALLDRGHFIVGGSLRLDRGRVSWIKGRTRYVTALY